MTRSASNALSRRLALAVFAAVGLYAGFQAGQRLGVAAILYQHLEQHAPSLVEIARTLAALPDIMREVRLARGTVIPACAPTGGGSVRTRPSSAGHGPQVVVAPAGSGETHPRHWPRDPFEKP